MKINWAVTKKDIAKLKQFYEDFKSEDLVQERINLNIKKNKIVINENVIIKRIIMCLLTSQQKSGPNSAVGKFSHIQPFPLNWDYIKGENDINDFTKEILKKFKLTRFIDRISNFFTQNITKLTNDNWCIVKKLEDLSNNKNQEFERKIADLLDDYMIGFGPKQSRNFLQALGLTRYEIPIDSRITKWLNEFGFPVTLSPSTLSDKYYYHFILDGIQKLCKEAKIYPCLLDAAIFSSYEKQE